MSVRPFGHQPHQNALYPQPRAIARAGVRLYLLRRVRALIPPAGAFGPGDPRNGAQSRHPRRQVRSRQEPHLRHRVSGAGPPLHDAEGARPACRSQHRGVCDGLPRLAAGHARPAVHPGAAPARSPRHPISGRHQRGHRRHGAVGIAAGGVARGGQVRRRVRPLVRQGPGGRSHRRRLPSRQFRRHLQTWRRARAHGRRPHGRNPPPRHINPSITSST